MTTLLITVLALNDFLASVAMVDHIILMRFLVRYTSVLGCQLTYVINHFFVFNSVIFLNPIGMERCLRVCTLNPKYQVTKKRAIFIIGSMSMYSLLTASRHFVLAGVEDTDIVVSNNLTVVGQVCSLLQDPEYSAVIDAFHLGDVIGFVITNMFLAIVYGILARKVGLAESKIGSYPVSTQNVSLTVDGSNTSTADSGGGNTVRLLRHRNYRERKINVMLGTITLGFGLSFIPYFYVVIIIKPQLSPGAYTYKPLVQTGWRSFMLSSSINPYIIGLFNSNFRAFVRKLITCKNR